MRDLEDTLQADAEFKRSLQANIEELYLERKSAKAAAESQIAALQADIARLQAASGSSPKDRSTDALLQEKTSALAAARMEVRGALLYSECFDYPPDCCPPWI